MKPMDGRRKRTPARALGEAMTEVSSWQWVQDHEAQEIIDALRKRGYDVTRIEKNRQQA